MRTVIPILNGHVWIDRYFFQGLRAGGGWGAIRRFRSAEELHDILVNSERQHERLFAADAGGYIYGSGFILSINIEWGGFGEYSFVGCGMPEIKVPGVLIYD